MSFRSRMEELAIKKETNIILALDFPYENPENSQQLYRRAEHILNVVHPYICAVKINHHLVLPLGVFNGVQKLVEKAHQLDLLTIMDCKANDVGATNQVIAQYYYAAGFDALIANPFIGWEEGLEPIFEVARNEQHGIILLVYMSHKGAKEGYGQTIYDTEKNERIPQYIAFAEKALKWKADGAVVGATYPEKIREVYKILGEKVPIYSPGIGVQGGEIRAALEAGARYLIVGRGITSAENPAESAQKIQRLTKA